MRGGRPRTGLNPAAVTRGGPDIVVNNKKGRTEGNLRKR